MYPPESVDWSGISHLVVTRVKTDGGGRVQTDFDIDPVNGPPFARSLASLAHQNGRKAILMLGGAGQGTGIRDSASPQNRAIFVENLLQLTHDLGFDGIDLDWEDDVDMASLIALAAALRESSSAPAGLILTGPGHAINPNIEAVDPNVVALVTYLDQYNIMTYYPATALAGSGWLSWHNSPLSGAKPATPVSIEDSLARYAAAGVPKAKLGMGIGFFAICYTGGITAPNQSTENGVTIEGGDNVMPLSWLFGSSGPYRLAYRFWDSAAQNPYLSLPTPESHGCRYFSYDDAESILAKGQFAKDQGYGGTIVWTLNQGTRELTQALRTGFLEP